MSFSSSPPEKKIPLWLITGFFVRFEISIAAIDTQVIVRDHLYIKGRKLALRFRSNITFGTVNSKTVKKKF